MTRRVATLDDVARAAGVSLQTVSRVLNSPNKVAARTQDAVHKAMRELHYVPNRSAQLLAGKVLPAIGLISASLTLHAPSQIAASVKTHAQARGLDVSIAMLNQTDYGSLQAALAECRAQNIGGAIVNLPLESAMAEQLARDNPDIHCLFLDVPPDSDVASLLFDHQQGCRAIVDHLWGLGHREFGFLAGPESAISARLRLHAWRDALHRNGGHQAITAFGDWSAGSGFIRTVEMLAQQPTLSAIVVANDQMALGVLSALAQLDRREISVTGYDDTPDSQYFQPALTTVAQDFHLLGERAVALLAEPARRHHRLPTRLIVRQSTAPKSSAAPRDTLIAQIKALARQL
ncbi:LacI family DNA-binding transcriptional regulator [Atlantibacter subterranea]|uniref:LacI family DNA-binding transcriptional regulator n=1 Tax=Atlantibacter subterraneus TaxID=255519 RepID=UPI001182CD54|nr:LacI family DNA-binding transcriptional regulator [Atlantibacter subterranea]TSJ58873.1 LacI family DNA-binding transcriptional regulator [Atlantibacter subterranea]